MFSCAGFEIRALKSLSNFFIYPHNFVFLSHKQAKISAYTVLDHDNYYAAKKAKLSWPDTCISVFGLRNLLQSSFCTIQKKVFD